MKNKLSRQFILGVGACLALFPAQGVEARRYPITKSDTSGTWVGTRQGLLHGRGELWKSYGAGAGLPVDQVNDLSLSTRSVWVATPKGLARMDKGSRRWEIFTTPDLPTPHVTGVSLDASDPDQVWVSTLGGGIAQYNVRTNSWTRYSMGSAGIPSDVVHDVFFSGRTVWAATEAGLAAFDVRQKTWTVYSKSQGLAGDKVLEIDDQGTDLWLTSDQGLSRMNMQRRTFSRFGRKEGLPGTRVLSQARAQTLVYFVTDGGLITYDTSADSLAPFVHQEGLQGARVRSVAAAGGFVWFASDKGLMRFDPTKKVWEYYRVEDGLSSDDLVRLSVSGSLLLIFGKDGELDTYDYKKDEWMERTSLLERGSKPGEGAGAGSGQPEGGAAAGGGSPDKEQGGEESPDVEAKPGPLDLSFSAELDTELKQDLRWPEQGDLDREGFWLVNAIRLGAGARWGLGRSLDFSGKLDWGDIWPALEGDTDSLAAFQRYEFRLRYLGARQDWLREVILSNALRVEPEGGRLTESTEVEGGRVVTEFGPRRNKGRFLKLRAEAGVRRGTPLRVVFRRPTVETLQIKRFKLYKPRADGAAAEVRFIIPNSVRALLDGRELERNVDYFVDHESGVLWMKNTDLINALAVLEVELEYEQIPRKNVGMVSLTDLLPRDGNIGQIKRSGQARWAKDEKGLFDEIDGGAEQYINRGWQQTLSQDYEWGNAGVSLRIHDMGEAKNAQAILLNRKLPDAKLVPNMQGVYLEKQSASLSIKMVHGRYFIEVSIDQPTMEQEILSLAGWLMGKLSAKGSTTADALRDVLISTSATFQFSDRGHISLEYLGTRSIVDQEVVQAHGAQKTARDLLSINADYSRRFKNDLALHTRLQAAASSASIDDAARHTGAGVRGDALLTSPWLVLRVDGRKYTRDYDGIGVARQTEFCRDERGDCTGPGASRLDYEVGLNAKIKALSWLPVSLTYQRQSSLLGRDYFEGDPRVVQSRDREGVRDIAMGGVSFDWPSLPKITLGGGYIGRQDALAEQAQVRASAALESDLASGLLKGLSFKKIYLRGRYDYGNNLVDEFLTDPNLERDRAETMHHAVGQLRLAPTLTESGYITLDYHGLQGVLDSSAEVLDSMTYWRLDAGAGSSIVPGLAARFDSTIWFGDDMPLGDRYSRGASLSTTKLAALRSQEADSRLSGVVDLFPGEWIKALTPLKFNVAYTYTETSSSKGQRRAVVPMGKERCDIKGDEDGDGYADCQDPDCALADQCLQITGQLKSHRVYSTLFWDTPGKLQVELFGDMRLTYSGNGEVLRATRQEVRSYITWRPSYPAPVTLRFDVQRETKRPQAYDGIQPQVEPWQINWEPALEFRQRWSPRWWHLAKLSFSYNQVRDLPHIRTIEDVYGRKGDLERLNYDNFSVTPSLELRRRFEDPAGRWSVRPYARASFKLQWGSGIQSVIDNKICKAGDACLSDGSETSRLSSFSLGLLYVASDKIWVDLDLNTSYYECIRGATGSRCLDRVSFTPHLLTTIRY